IPTPTKSNWINAIIVGPDQSLWIGTSGAGIHRLRNGSWTTFDHTKGLPDNSVLCLLEDSGTIYAGTAHGLAHFQNGKWTSDPISSRVLSLAKSPQGFWVGTENGLFLNGNPVSGINDRIRTLAYDDALWAGTPKGLYRYYNDRITKYDTTNGLP